MIVTLDTHRREMADKRKAPQIRTQAIERIRYSLAHDPAIAELVLVVGLPGAGKSTWAAANDRRDRVIYDACNLTPDRRARVIIAAGSMTHTIHMIHIETPLDLCMRRNRDRPFGVPPDLLAWMARTLIPPTPEEADRITVIRGDNRPHGNK